MKMVSHRKRIFCLNIRETLLYLTKQIRMRGGSNLWNFQDDWGLALLCSLVLSVARGEISGLCVAKDENQWGFALPRTKTSGALRCRGRKPVGLCVAREENQWRLALPGTKTSGALRCQG